MRILLKPDTGESPKHCLERALEVLRDALVHPVGGLVDDQAMVLIYAKERDQAVDVLAKSGVTATVG